MAMVETDTVIVGGGLCGLAVASGLQKSNGDYALYEARARFGGRIASEPLPEDGIDAERYDLGPAWIWPHNRRMLALARELSLSLFEQHASGNLVFEGEDGAVRRDLTFSTMAGSLRVKGGLASVAEALSARLPHDRVSRAHVVENVEDRGGRLRVSGTGPEGPFAALARHVVMALPPRVAARDIRMASLMDENARSALQGVPTWMAGHAKAVFVYRRPFWREADLSGGGISHRGPLAEIHDASPFERPEGALFGFFGVPANARRNRSKDVLAAALSQLTRMFGNEAATPIASASLDWAHEPYTATDADRTPPPGHPVYGTPAFARALSKRGLHFAGSELAAENGGYLEGALEAAETVLGALAKAGVPSPRG